MQKQSSRRPQRVGLADRSIKGDGSRLPQLDHSRLNKLHFVTALADRACTETMKTWVSSSSWEMQ